MDLGQMTHFHLTLYPFSPQQVFTGNNDSNSVHLQYLKHFMFARFIRLVPLEWNDEISLRLEVYGCYLQGAE